MSCHFKEMSKNGFGGRNHLVFISITASSMQLSVRKRDVSNGISKEKKQILFDDVFRDLDSLISKFLYIIFDFSINYSFLRLFRSNHVNSVNTMI